MSQIENISKEVDSGWRAFWLRRGMTTPPAISNCNVGMFDLPGTKFEFGCIAPDMKMNKKTPTKKQILADIENIEESGIENQ